MNQTISTVVLTGALLWTVGCASASKKPTTDKQGSVAADAATQPDRFAPMAEDEALASIWNDPAFTRRLIGTYAPATEVEPRVSPEEGLVFQEQIRPLLRDDQGEAIQQLQALIKPDSTALFEFTLGTLYFQNGDLTNAVRYFDQAIAKFDDFRRAWQNLGFAYARNGEYGEAIEPLARAIGLGANDGGTYGLLGFCYMNGEQWVSAEAAFRQAMLLEPDNADYRLWMVKCLVQQENFSAASAALDELLARHPEREQIWAIQANVYLQTDRPVLASVNLEVLRRMGKASAKNLIQLGDIYMLQEATALALPVYLEAIGLEGGDDLKPALRAAEIMVGRGAWAESTELFAKIREVGGDQMSDEDRMKLLKLESKVAMAQGQGDQAIQVLEDIVELNPLDGEALLLAGDYYSRAGNLEKAQFRYDLASKIEGFEADAFVKQAQLMAQSSKYVEAVELLRKAQKIKPRDNVQNYLEAIERVARTSGSG